MNHNTLLILIWTFHRRVSLVAAHKIYTYIYIYTQRAVGGAFFRSPSSPIMSYIIFILRCFMSLRKPDWNFRIGIRSVFLAMVVRGNRSRVYILQRSFRFFLFTAVSAGIQARKSPSNDVIEFLM